MNEKDNDHFLRQIFESINHPFYVVNAKTYEVEMANSAAGKLTPGIKCHQLTHRQNTPCDTPLDPCPLRQVVLTKKPFVVYHTHHDSAGRECQVEVFGFPVFDEKGEVSQMVEYSIDVTDRKNAEEKLINYKNFLQVAFENIPEAIYIQDENHNTVLVNRAFKELLNFSESDIKYSAEFLKIFDTNKKILDERESSRSIKSASGNIIEAIIRHLSLENINKTNYKMTIINDISEIRRAQQDLVINTQMLRETFENAPDAIIWIDAFSSEIINSNRATCRLLELGLDEIISRDFYFLFPEDKIEAYRLIFTKLLEKNAHDLELEIQTSSGERKICLMNTVLITIQGKLIFQVILRDNTERKKAEKEKEGLNHKVYVASKMASLGELASGVGHEINNPLTVMKGYNKLLLNKIEKGQFDNKTVLDLLKVQSEMIDRVSEIVTTLRAYSHTNDGEATVVNVAVAVECAVKLLKNIYQKENVVITTDCGVEKIEILGQQGKLQQIIINLLSNGKDAIKEVSASGTINVVVEVIDKRVFIRVRDSGKGVSPDIREKIFESFYTTKPQGKGTGLGLSISFGFAQQMGGRLSLNTEYKGGAEFFVELPLAK